MKKLTLLITFIIHTTVLLACFCTGPDNFCESLIDFNGNFLENPIVDATIIKKESDRIEIKIHAVLSGDLPQEKIFIKNGSSAACERSTDNFSEDENYLFVISEYNDSYYLSICYVSFLKKDNGILEGPIAPGIESLPYEDLFNLVPCGSGLEIIPTNNSFPSINKVSVFPNPTSSNVVFKNLGELELDNEIHLEVIDALGRSIKLFKKEDGIQEGEDWIINVSEWSTGIYFFRLISGDRKEIFKIMKR